MHRVGLGRASWLAVSVTCLVAAVCYAGAVTTNALVAGVLVGVVVCAFAAGLQATKRGVGFALLTGLVIAFGWSALVNTFTGDTNGPAARSTLIAGACTSLAVAASRTRRPSSFLVPVGGIVFGAVALGAGGEVRVVALAVVVVAVVTLAVLEHERRRWLAGGARRATVLLVALLVGAAGLIGALVQAQHDGRTARVLDPSAVNATIHPTWGDPLPKPAPVHRTDTRVGKTNRSASKPHVRHHSNSRVWLWIGLVMLGFVALLLLVLLALLMRLLVVRHRWRRVRRALRSGAPGQVVAGAWVWARMRLAACRLPLSASAAPDLDGSSAALADLPVTVAEPLRKLSPHAAVCAFSAAPLADVEDVARAWRLADEATAAGVAALTGWGRWRVRFTSPVEAPRSGKAARMSPAVRHG